MNVKVKVCGVTTREAARAAVDAGVDALGYVFAESPRRLEIPRAVEIASAVPSFVLRVAVFRHPQASEVAEVLSRFRPHLVQTEPDECLKDLPEIEPVTRAAAPSSPTWIETIAALHPGVTWPVAPL